MAQNPVWVAGSHLVGDKKGPGSNGPSRVDWSGRAQVSPGGSVRAAATDPEGLVLGGRALRTIGVDRQDVKALLRLFLQLADQIVEVVGL